MQLIDSKYWWIFSIRGCLAVVFGILALLLWPILELGPMGSFFGIYIFIQGVLTLIAYLKIKKSSQSLPVLLESLLGISIGTFLVLLTDFIQTLFIVSFITWGIGIGMCKVIHAVFLYRNQRFFLVLGINGLLSIFLNLMIYIQAEVTKEPIVWILSIYFVVYGFLMIIFGAKLKASKD
jgi:uncharacterized membrane protein HdeD (DUF308 family)